MTDQLPADAHEAFEREAERFHKATGYLAPGKSQARAMQGSPSDEERRGAWAVWQRLSPQLPQGQALQITSETLDDGKGLVNIAIPDDWPFEKLMMACEYLLCLTASQSLAGFEKALELLCAGATTYRKAEKDRPEKENADA